MLHKALVKKEIEPYEYLVSQKANVNAITVYGDTPLFEVEVVKGMASKTNETTLVAKCDQIIEFLKKNGAKPSDKDRVEKAVQAYLLKVQKKIKK